MSKMKTSLYNQDGSLCSEAQLLLHGKPDNMTKGEWRKSLKEFRSQLSSEDLKKFERLRLTKSNARWRANNPQKSKEYNAKYYAEDPEKSKQYTANWLINHPEKAKESQTKSNAKWCAKNPEKIKQRNMINGPVWRANNPEYPNRYQKQRRSKDPLYRFQQNIRTACNRIVRQVGLGNKPTNTFKWVGCSPEELKVYFETLFTEGMSWENYGEWHVDHIRPICSFSAEEWEQINHYTNLQPLWAEDNYAKISSDLKQRKS
jgi:hypothetical protein